MANKEDIINFEVKRFRESQKLFDNNKKYPMIKTCLEKALRDTFVNSYIKYKDEEEKIIKSLTVIIEKFEKDDFSNIDKKFEILVKKFCEALKSTNNNKLRDIAKSKEDNDKKQKDSQKKAKGEGRIYKFASMTFKYLYCYKEIRNNETRAKNFKGCYLPLDRYTLNWYLKNKNADEKVKKDLKEINKAWSNIYWNLYERIQKDVQKMIDDKSLEYDYFLLDEKNKVSCYPESRLELEFIIWEQEKWKKNNKGKA